MLFAKNGERKSTVAFDPTKQRRYSFVEKLGRGLALLFTFPYIYLQPNLLHMKIPEPLPVKRISMTNIYRSILSSLNLEKGFFFTAWGLLVRPGKAIREFLFTENRTKYVKPLGFLLFCVTISVIISVKCALGDTGALELGHTPAMNGLTAEEVKAALSKLLKTIFQYQNLLEIFKVPFLSLLTWQFFKNSGFNFAEHLVINAFALGMQSLFSLFFLPLILLVDQQLAILSSILFFIYYIYLYIKVFQPPMLHIGILKSFLACSIGYLLHGFIIAGVLYFYFSFINPDPIIIQLLMPPLGGTDF